MLMSLRVPYLHTLIPPSMSLVRHIVRPLVHLILRAMLIFLGLLIPVLLSTCPINASGLQIFIMFMTNVGVSHRWQSSPVRARRWWYYSACHYQWSGQAFQTPKHLVCAQSSAEFGFYQSALREARCNYSCPWWVQNDQPRWSRRILMTGSKSDGLWRLHITSITPSNTANLACVVASSSGHLSQFTLNLHGWHTRLSHASFRTIRDMSSRETVFGLPSFSKATPLVCIGCVHGKIHRHPFPVNT